MCNCIEKNMLQKLGNAIAVYRKTDMPEKLVCQKSDMPEIRYARKTGMPEKTVCQKKRFGRKTNMRFAFSASTK